jgi:hypothetical protein
MKIILITSFAVAIGIAVLSFTCSDNNSVQNDSTSLKTEAQNSSIGITTSGRVGVKLTENLCINSATGVTEVCL